LSATPTRYAIYVWVLCLFVLAFYETWAVFSGRETLSRAVWTADTSQYGLVLPLLAGILAAHFFMFSLETIQAFLFGLVAGMLFFHRGIDPPALPPGPHP
jgi:hypothetical protein